MKKIFACFALLLLFLSVATVGKVSADVNDFRIANYTIDYYLARDAQNHSTLKTVEVIQANFPSIDQNHGIERAIPLTYDSHPTALSVQSVVDDSGNAIPYTLYESNDNQVVRIGEADTYVHGLKTYKLTYTQQDVTKYFSDTSSDEFYWDTNGTEWSVPIDALSVNIHLADTLTTERTDAQACYVGPIGAQGSCPLAVSGNDLSVQSQMLAPGENITLAVGFKPHTFATYVTPPIDKVKAAYALLQVLLMPIVIVILCWLLIRYQRFSNRSREVGTIIPEYTPPKDVSVSVAGSLLARTTVFSAQIVDLAVRGYVKIYQVREKSFFRAAQYELEVTKDARSLRPEEREILDDMFFTPTVGSRINLKDLRKTLIRLNFTDNAAKLTKSIEHTYLLRAVDPTTRGWFKRCSLILLILSVLTLSPIVFLAVIVSFVMAFAIKPLTDRGLELVRFLKGLEMYIKTAEADRLRMLQSPEGAQKIGMSVDPQDTRQLIKLYEAVLPYAILFGQEKQWNKVLGQYYQTINESPLWFAGTYGAFNAAAFSTALSSFNTATYSSSGGSGGGGSSGGGGGGGGGGGW